MMYRLKTYGGIPRRMREPMERGTPVSRKVSFGHDASDNRIVPLNVRIEVAGGRNSTASAMRAATVQKRLEQVGGAALTTSVDGGQATVHAELDAAQIEHAATLPFVRRISLS